MRRALVLAALTGVLSGGCWISSPPTHPHGQDELEPQKLAALSVADPVGLRSRRLLVLGRFDTVGTQPIGALYDHDDYSLSPLYRTYLFRDGALELFENACDALRATGLEVRKDYATEGEPTLLEERLRARDPLVVSGFISHLQHDQVRTDDKQPGDYEVAKLVITIVVRDATGAERFHKDLRIEGKIPAAPQSNMLRTLGLKIGELLTRDPAFLKAVEASS